MSLRSNLGHCKTLIYRRPRDELRRLRNWGAQAYFFLPIWQREMETKAAKLPHPVPNRNAAQVELWFLTGQKFWYQTAFCAWTFAHQTGRPVTLNLIDDGTLRPTDESSLRRLFPQGSTVRKNQVKERLETYLPAAQFPVLHQRWTDYVHIRKLIDIHLGSMGKKLVFDSDMLFFSQPNQLLNWIDDAKSESILMTDSVESYGYSRELMKTLCGANIPAKLNVGICGLKSETLDWNELEYWASQLAEKEGTSYYLEQAIVAMLAARSGAEVLPARDYITYPTSAQGKAGDGVLQHYVADSKPCYFHDAWRRAIS